MCALYEYFCISLIIVRHQVQPAQWAVGQRSPSLFTTESQVLQTWKQNEKKSNATLEKAKMKLLMWRIKSRFMCEWCFNLEPDLLTQDSNTTQLNRMSVFGTDTVRNVWGGPVKPEKTTERLLGETRKQEVAVINEWRDKCVNKLLL